MDIAAAMQVQDAPSAFFVLWNDSVHFHPCIIVVLDFRPHEIFTDFMLFAVFLEVPRKHFRIHLFQIEVGDSDQVLHNLAADTSFLHKNCTAGINECACTCQKQRCFNYVLHPIIPFNS